MYISTFENPRVPWMTADENSHFGGRPTCALDDG